MDERFFGTWRLQSWENRDEAGAVSHPVGRAPLGLLHYAPDGYMFVHIMRVDRRCPPVRCSAAARPSGPRRFPATSPIPAAGRSAAGR